MADTDIILARLEPACRMLAECKDAVGAKHVADLARAAEVYARRQKYSEEAIAAAKAVRIDALTLMGEFQKAAPKNTGAAGRGEKGAMRGTLVEPRIGQPPTLADLHISKKESSEAQALATLATEEPELHQQVREGEMSITSARKQRKNRESARKAYDIARVARADPENYGDLPGLAEADGVDKAYRQMLRRDRQVLRGEPVKKAEPKNKGVGEKIAREAVKCLKRIPKRDFSRERGLLAVVDWIGEQLGLSFTSAGKGADNGRTKETCPE